MASTPPPDETTTPEPTWQSPGPLDRFDFIILGDTAYGANYQERVESRGGHNILKRYGYDYGLESVRHILHDANLVIANLETPLTERRDSPFKDIRPYIHYDDPELTPRHLLKHNISAVTLANNHTPDMGPQGLVDTLNALDRHDMLTIGAGRNRTEAERPLRVFAEIRGGDPFRASVLARFRGGKVFRETLQAYATENLPGSAPMHTRRTAEAVADLRRQNPDEFVLVIPHWRRDYQWASDTQRNVAKRLLAAGASMIVGHGSHMAQEIDFVDGRLVLNGIGNFLFNSPGRYRKTGVPPYSLIARLIVDRRGIEVRLYPIHTDNRDNDYQPRPVSRSEFSDFNHHAASRTNEPELFSANVLSAEDAYGYHLVVRTDRSGALIRTGRARKVLNLLAGSAYGRRITRSRSRAR